MTDYSNPLDNQKDNKGINYSYYCQRCNRSLMQMIELRENGQSVPKIRTFIKKDGSDYVGRFLMCGHSINASEQPLSTNQPTKIQLAEGNLVDPEELRTINLEETLKFAKMNDEQKELHIQFHVEQYKLHLLASKKEKYIIQLLEDLVEKLIRDLSATSEEERQIKRNKEVKFGYLFRKPEKRLEIIAKEKVREDKKVKKTEESTENVMDRLRALMASKGLTIADLK